MKILHLPTNVAGNSYGLALGERALGLQSEVLQAVDTWLHYPADVTLAPEMPSSLFQWTKLGAKAVDAFLKVRDKYDVFHFDFGSSLLDMMERNINLWDLPYYNGVTAMTYQGCDARQKYPTIERTTFSACHNDDCYEGKCLKLYRDKTKQKRIDKVAKHVDLIYALNPDLLCFLPDRAEFLPYTIPSWNDITPVRYEVNDPIRIVHAPTDRAVKGTDTILAAIKSLEREYPGKIDFRLIEKMPHNQALEEYKTADLVIDQLLVGWYGAFAVELMKMGVPVMTYIRDEDLQFIPTEMKQDLDASIIKTIPHMIKFILAEIIEEPDVLYYYHKQGMEYVNTWHDPVKIAKRVVDDYSRCLNA